MTLRPPLLLSIAALTACFVIVLEYLSQLSHRNGGLVFAINSLSTTATLSHLYLPTVIAVFYSILWSWIDLDTKRLEPYFQMSKEGGVLAKDSLFLHYPVDFVAFVPYRAFRRK